MVAADDDDAVVDFDSALRDPAQPTKLRPEYDSGDHLHPSDAGYAVMASGVDLWGCSRPAGNCAQPPADATAHPRISCWVYRSG